MAERRDEGPRSFTELRFVVVGTYVADCVVRTPRLPAWGREYEAAGSDNWRLGTASSTLARAGARAVRCPITPSRMGGRPGRGIPMSNVRRAVILSADGNAARARRSA
jgi:hypothetical protein